MLHSTVALCLLLPAGAIALAVFALVDAAYSGDWSRIGAITKEQELTLQASWLQQVLQWYFLLCGGSAPGQSSFQDWDLQACWL